MLPYGITRKQKNLYPLFSIPASIPASSHLFRALEFVIIWNVNLLIKSPEESTSMRQRTRAGVRGWVREREVLAVKN